MPSPSRCVTSMVRLASSSTLRPPPARVARRIVALPPTIETRRYIGGRNKQLSSANKKKKAELEREKKKKAQKEYKTPSLAKLDQYSLCDAMRVIRAVEVGKPPSMVKYDLAARLLTNKNARPIRNRIIFPHPVSLGSRIIVICPDKSKTAEESINAGAVAAGQNALFDLIRNRKIQFDKVIAHTDSFAAMQRAGLGPILRNLTPSPRTKTVTSNVTKLIKEMSSAEQYRERHGTVRVCIGQLSFTPKMLGENIRSFIAQLKEDMKLLEASKVDSKSLHEVVLSSTNGPGLSLDGSFESADPALRPEHLTGPM